MHESTGYSERADRDESTVERERGAGRSNPTGVQLKGTYNARV